MKYIRLATPLRAVLTALAWLLAAGTASAQDAARPTLAFRHLSTAGGLSSNAVWALCKDSYGYLWAGTENGLNRFDGLTCKAYFHHSGEAKSISGSYVHQLLPDTGGDVWAGTQSGLSRYQRSTDDFRNYTFPGAKGSAAQPQYAFPFFVDDARRLWLYLGAKGAVFTYTPGSGKLDPVSGISNGYLFAQQPLYTPLRSYITRAEKGIYISGVEDGKLRSTRPFFTASNAGQPVTFIDQVLSESDTLLWLCADAGLIALNPQNGRYSIYNSYAGRPVDANCIAALDARTLLIGTAGEGLLLFDWVQKKFTAQYHHFTGDPQSLAGNTVYRCLLDTAGNLFLSVADYGVDYTNVRQAVFSPLLGSEAAALDDVRNNITAVLGLDNDRLLCGTAESGLLLYDAATQRVARRISSVPGGKVESLTALMDGQVLVRTAKGFARYDTATGQAQPLALRSSAPLNGHLVVQHLARLADGTLLAATERGLARVSVAKGIIDFEFDKGVAAATEWDNYQFVAPLNDTLLLLQAYSTNLYLLSYKAGVLKVLREVARTPFRTNGMAVMDGWAYLATTSGLLRLHIASGTLDDRPGAVTATCQGIAAAGDHTLWVTTTAGLYRYDARSRSARHYTQEDGLQDDLFNPGAIAVTRTGAVAAAGIDGLNVFKPGQLAGAGHSAGLAVHSILVNDLPFSDTLNAAACTALQLDYRHNTLAFGFSVIDYISPLQDVVYYQLSGYDAQPVAAMGSGIARYARLPPGEYRFTVSCGGVQRTIAISIAPPWWQRWWARITALLLAAGLIAAAFYLRIRSIQARQKERIAIMIRSGEEERRRIARDLHDDFGARLSTLKLYMQAAGKDASMLGQSALLIDDSIRELRGILMNLSPKALEENGLQAAVAELAERMNATGALRCEADLSAFAQRLKPQAEYALYRIAQELINNTLKYAEARHIYLSFVVREGMLVFLYEDDGRGFDPQQVTRGYGLTNIETHVQSLPGTLTLDTAEGRGTAMTIETPLNSITI